MNYAAVVWLLWNRMTDIAAQVTRGDAGSLALLRISRDEYLDVVTRYRREHRRRQREALERAKHPCRATNCPRRCQPQFLMCWIHWCQVPRALQRRIYDTCAAGMGGDYYEAVTEAVEIIAGREMKKEGLVMA